VTRTPRAGHDAGAAAVWAVGLTGLLMVGLLVLLLVVAVLAARSRAAAAADLAALAAAPAAAVPVEACLRAEQVAGRNGATLPACDIRGGEVWVTANVPVPPVVRRLIPLLAHGVSARSHAGLR